MLGRILRKIAANLLLKLVVAILGPIPLLGTAARVVAFVC